MKGHRVWYSAKGPRVTGLRLNIYLILWILIIIGSVYLLVRFAAISFSHEMGQAGSYQDAVYYYISNKVIESGSSLVSYHTGGEEAAVFPLNMLSRHFPLASFIKDQGFLISDAEKKLQETYAKEKIERYLLPEGSISEAYLLTNGTYYNDRQARYAGNTSLGNSGDRLSINSVEGDLDFQESEEEPWPEPEAIETSNPGNVVDYTMEQLKDVSFLVRNFYIVDSATKVTDGLFDAEELLGKDMRISQKSDQPQILIYHTHSQETYIDSRSKEKADTVVGVGSHLAQILEDTYGYNVIHDTTCYDIIDGKLERSKAYNKAKDGVQQILEDNPTIEVIIDLHRDGAENKRTTVINGKETAQIMLFNGLSRDQDGPIAYLENPYIQDNLALSLQMQLKAIELYPGLFYKNYLNCYRYNMHLKPKCILMELGTNKNTLESAKNAMEPFARVLNAVLQGE